jgi:predicted ATP-dependent endonuclease of OLD family
MVKISKFRVFNYKSIIDSGDCYVNGGVTILAGKNESGKTSLLEALEDYDVNSQIRDSAKPIKDAKLLAQISVTFEINFNTINSILETMSFDKKFDKNIQVQITKFPSNKYYLAVHSAESLGFFAKDILSKIKADHTAFSNKVRQLIMQKYPGLNLRVPDLASPYTGFPPLLEKFKADVEANYSTILTEDMVVFSNAISTMENTIGTYIKGQSLREQFVETFNESWQPNFILFKSFEDVFPNKIPFNELKANEWIKDLAIISDLDVHTIQSNVDRQKHKHKKDVNISLNDEYKKFWTQDLSNLSIDWDSQNLFFWIEEDGYPYEPSLRSKGRQWHLAFYIKISARSREDVSNIILIDEPGLFLHAQALKDILEKLESASKEAQIIFSTHSPYLLEADKLSRIKLIHRTSDSGTKVENKIHALADKETLTPILTAIGLELNAGIINVDKEKNVIVEGPSDYYYLQAFKLLLNKPDINFIFGGGAGNMPIVGTILHGWGCKVVYLFDNDKGKKDGERNLTKNWLASKQIILSVLEKDGTIEDVFEQNDFKSYVLKGQTVGYSAMNSEYVKTEKMDKVLLAKLFFDSLHSNEIKLSDATLSIISVLFDKIQEKFR